MKKGRRERMTECEKERVNERMNEWMTEAKCLLISRWSSFDSENNSKSIFDSYLNSMIICCNDHRVILIAISHIPHPTFIIHHSSFIIDHSSSKTIRYLPLLLRWISVLDDSMNIRGRMKWNYLKHLILMWFLWWKPKMNVQWKFDDFI
jgi:hypothetical protein